MHLNPRRGTLALICAVAFALVATSPAATPAKPRKKPVADETAPPKKKTPAPATTTNDEPAVKPTAKTKKTADEPDVSPPPKTAAAPNASIAPEEIMEFHAQPAGVRRLIESSLELARKNLTYTFGSADPASGGLDCSGYIYYVLRQHGLTQVPRDSSGLYLWVRKARGFRAVISRKPDSVELDELLPGDLLFWTGTYSVERDPPVTHTMIYLGKKKESGKPIMVGASDGRTYEGEQQFGVSVFDFKTARAKAASASGNHPRFVGYGKIPGLESEKP